MGDLNFRLREDTLSYNDIVQEISDNALQNLLEIDQLKNVQRDNLAFHELNEAPISFAPTFKHVIGSDAYDMKRRPAWTDRILSRVNTHNLEDLGKIKPTFFCLECKYNLKSDKVVYVLLV